MRFGFALVSLVSTLLAVASAAEVLLEGEPEVSVYAAFPEDNPFGHVTNGEKNKLVVFVENKTDRNVTLKSISGSMANPETSQVIKNLTTLSYELGLPSNVAMQFPYSFYSEFKPGDLKLNIWIQHVTDDATYTVPAYDSIITVVEPEASWFDYQLISTYLITAAFFAGIGYLSYTTLFPSSKKKARQPKAASTANTAGTTTSATGTGGYEDEWIPEHHKVKTSTKKGNKGTAVSSGDELSGGDTSGGEGRKRKGKK